jgi:aspartyl-tRNA(Asn)/glutamyl-tRNA(Gln) amidotransferase subunit B
MNAVYMPVIGLEVHVQLATASKIFCSCSTDSMGAEPNRNVCPVCLGLPGTLPVMNEHALRLGIRAGLALSCAIRDRTIFHRKNYFYPDLPKAYQISQYDLPLAEGGEIVITGDDGAPKRIRITRLHLEEDAGKLVHSAADGRLEGAERSFVDYNRGGVPLAEIVSEPDMSSPREAREYVQTLRRLVRYLGVSDGDMEKGSLRVDANISLKKVDGATGDLLFWGERSEVKNMNSLRAVERALAYEIERQRILMERGGTPERETRHWNDGAGVTTAMRSKEAANDYRYFPDPDLPPMLVTEAMEERERRALPEMPWKKAERFTEQYGLPAADVEVLVESLPLADYFEACVAAGASPLRASNWVRVEVFRVMNERKLPADAFPVAALSLGRLVAMVDEKKLSTTVAREVFDAMAGGKSLDEALKGAGAAQGGIASEALEGIIRAVVAQNPDVLDEIRSGKDGSGKKRKFLTGLVMKETRGQADGKQVQAILDSVLGELL